VNIIKRRVDGLPDEREYLHVPFSTFTIDDVKPSASPTADNPHKIMVTAAIDNAAEAEDLPLTLAHQPLWEIHHWRSAG